MSDYFENLSDDELKQRYDATVIATQLLFDQYFHFYDSNVNTHDRYQAMHNIMEEYHKEVERRNLDVRSL